MNGYIALNLVLIWVILLLNLFLTLVLVRVIRKPFGGNTNDALKLKTGQPAPRFTALTLHEETVTLASYAHRSVAFVFVSPSCLPCREEIPSLESLGSKIRDTENILILVSADTVEGTRKFVDELKITLPVLVAPRETNSFLSDYGAMGTPFFCIVDKSGNVTSSGFLDDEWKRLTSDWTSNTSPSYLQRANLPV